MRITLLHMRCKLGYHRVFNPILWLLYTGMQVWSAGRADLCMGRQIQAVAAPLWTHSAAALWHEVDGIHVDQPASVLRCLKLATSYLGNSSGLFHWLHASTPAPTGARAWERPTRPEPRALPGCVYAPCTTEPYIQASECQRLADIQAADSSRPADARGGLQCARPVARLPIQRVRFRTPLDHWL